MSIITIQGARSILPKNKESVLQVSTYRVFVSPKRMMAIAAAYLSPSDLAFNSDYIGAFPIPCETEELAKRGVLCL